MVGILPSRDLMIALQQHDPNSLIDGVMLREFITLKASEMLECGARKPGYERILVQLIFRPAVSHNIWDFSREFSSSRLLLESLPLSFNLDCFW